MSHTPGPWSVDTNSNVPWSGEVHTGLPWSEKEPERAGLLISFIPNGEPPAAGPDTVPHEQARKANARLIATAPDLLVAARRAYTAIKRQKPMRCVNPVEMADAYSLLEAAIAKATGGPGAAGGPS